MKDGFYKKIGNGETIDIEKDVWAGRRICKKPTGPNVGDQTHLQYNRVVHLIDANGNWGTMIIWRLFKRNDAEAILAIQIPEGNQKDTLGWAKTKNGAFTVRSGY